MVLSAFRVVFFGTPEFSVPILKALAVHAQVVCAVSQPDRPSGRGCKMCKPAVKAAAEQLGIEVIQPDIAKGKKFAARIAAYEPDFLVTAAYGRILGRSVLDVPKKRALNVHASLLPKYRGAAPAAWAVLNGDVQTGVSIMEMVPELDAGPVYYQEAFDIGENETAGELLCRLAETGAAALVETLRRFDSITPVPQDHDRATYARMLTKQDGLLDWSRSARALHNHVCGMAPWPSAFTLFGEISVKVHASRLLTDDGTLGTPGQVISVDKQGIDIACGTGVLRLLELQAPGKKRMPVQAYIQGNPIAVGTVWGGTAKR